MRVHHRKDPGAAVGGERADRLGAAMFEEAREHGLVRRGELAARAVPCELQRHLDVRVRRELRCGFRVGNAMSIRRSSGRSWESYLGF